MYDSNQLEVENVLYGPFFISATSKQTIKTHFLYLQIDMPLLFVSQAHEDERDITLLQHKSLCHAQRPAL